MKGKEINHQIIGISLAAIILVIGILMSMKGYALDEEYSYYNELRILATDQLNSIKESFTADGFEQVKYQENYYPVVITDINGRILYNETEQYQHVKQLNVNEFIQMDQSWILKDGDNIKAIFAIDKAGETLGFAGIYIPKDQVVWFNDRHRTFDVFMPVIVGISMVIVYLIWNQIRLSRRMIQPVQEMVGSAKAIIGGNYNVPVVRNSRKKFKLYGVEQLAYYFELMRDELKEKRKREEDLKRSQKELITCISHDLKTPISTIKAYGEGLRDGIAKDEEKVLRYAEIIISKSEVLTKMIYDLLEHFNAELNQLTIIKKEQYFNEYINQLSLELEELVQYHHMNFTYENNAPNLLLTFDENRITQVISNLIENSIKYGKEHGNIGISVDYKDEQLVIKVSDDGNGIGIADIPFVFEKFYRGEKSRNMSIPGSGLGLSICKYIVEEHRGEILCESRYQEGTTFSIHLPLT